MPSSPQLSDTKRRLLERYLQDRGSPATRSAASIPRRPPGEAAPLSPSQEQIWLLERALPAPFPVHNESITIYRSGPLDVELLQRSFTEVIRRHEAWRTRFEVVDGQPFQKIEPAPSPFPVHVVDVRHLPESSRESDAMHIVGEEIQKTYDLERGPLVHATLVRLDDEEARFFVMMHQAVIDGISGYQILPHELASIYEALAAGQPSPLAELPIQFGDFAYWQHQWLENGMLAKQVGYWRKQLAGHLPEFNWPFGRPRPAVQTHRGGLYPFTISAIATEAARALSRELCASLFMILLAAFTTLLRCYTSQETVVVGTLVPTGRDRAEAAGLLGYFMNPVPLKFHAGDDVTFQSFLHQVREVTGGAVTNSDVPFHRLVRELRPRPDASRNPLFQAAISLGPPVADLNPGWGMTPMEVNGGGTRWDLYLVFTERPNGLIGRAQYNSDLFDSKTVERIVEDFRRFLEHLTSNPVQRLAEAKALLK